MTSSNNFSPSNFIKESIEVEEDFSPSSAIQSQLATKNQSPLTLAPETSPPEKESLFNAIGKGFSMQMQSGGFAGAPSATPKIAKDVAIEFGTIAAMEAAFAPIVGAAAASYYAPRLLSFLARTAQAGATGAAVTTTTKLADTGELPTKEELVKEGMTWAAIDVALQLAHIPIRKGVNFNAEATQLSKKYGVSKSTVYKAYWEQTKKKVKDLLGIKNLTKADLKKPQVQKIVQDVVKADPKEILTITDQPIDITPEGKVTTEKPKPIEKEVQVAKEELPKTIKDSITKNKKDIKSTLKNMNSEQYKKLPLDVQRHMQRELEAFKAWETPEYIEAVKQDYLSNPKKYDNFLVDPLFKYWNGLTPDEKRKYLLPQNRKIISQQIAGKPLTQKAPTELTQKPEAPKKPTVSTKPKEPKIGKKQAKKKSDIIDIFRKAFKDPLKQGKIRQGRGSRTLGIHKGWPKVSRLLKANDVETAAHEIGHNLHFTMYEGNAKTTKEQEANTIKALKPYLNELKPLAQYEPYTLEGFAEFTRMYVTNPDAAKALAPEFYKKFEADLDKDYPEMKNALLDARDYYDAYLEGDPRSVIRSHIARPVPERFLPKFMEWLRSDGKLDILKTGLLDDVFPAKRLVAEAFGITPLEVENLKHPLNLYKSLRILKGAIGKADVFLLHETFDPDTLKKTGESFKSILKGLSDEEVLELQDYLIALRVVEKAQQGIETGIPLAHAQELIEMDKDKYNDRAIRYYKYMDQLLQYSVKSGLMSNEIYKAIKSKNYYYSPFRRDMGKRNLSQRQGAGVQARQTIRKMKGSTRDLLPPFESSISLTYEIILNSEKNRTGQVLAELSKRKNIGKYVERVPAPIKVKAKISKEEVIKQIEKGIDNQGKEISPELREMVEIYGSELAEVMPEVFLRFGAGSYTGKENIVTVFYDGKPQYYEVSPEIYKMWKGVTSPATMNTILKILSIPSKTLRVGAILNLRFIQKNLVRDWWERLVFTKEGPKITDPKAFIEDIFSPFAMLAQAFKHGPIYVEWLKSGAGMSTLQSVDRLSSQKKLKELQKGMKKNVIAILRFAAEVSEEANRLGEFVAGVNNNPDTRFGKEQAAYASRDLSIDYAKQGAWTVAFNRLVAFYNTGVQGMDKLIRMFASKEDRPRAILKALSWLVIPSLLIAWLNKDDEDIKELQDQEKDFNILFKIGDKIKKLPVPFELGVIFHGLAQRMFDYFYSKDPDAFDGFIKSILEAGIPNLIPTFALPFIEIEANKNFFTGTRITPYSKERLQSKYQYKEFTSLTARQIGRAIDYIGGGDVRSKYAAPTVIDHLVRSWTGTWGQIALSTADEGLKKAGLGDNIPKPDRPITEKFGLDAFSVRYPRGQTKSIEKFYDQYHDMITKELSIKYADKNNLESPETLKKMNRDLDKKYDVKMLKKDYKAIQNIQHTINGIYQDPNMPSEEKTLLIDEMYKQMIEIAQYATKKH